MIDNKFSYASFEKLGFDSDEARKLSDELQISVSEEFDKIIREKLSEIVIRLNAMGHDLQVFEDETEEGTIDYGYRDHNDNGDPGRQMDYMCKLRVGISLIVSAGFGDIVKEGQSTGTETIQ